MSADGVPGAKGNPQFLGTGAPATATDLNLISQWAADNIDATVATPASLPGSGNWIGRRIRALSTNLVYEWSGSAWIVDAGSTRIALSRTANQTISSGGENAVTWPTQLHVGPMFTHSTSSNPSRITAERPCIVELTLVMAWSSNAAGTRRIGYRVNGGARTDIDFSAPPAAALYPQSGVAPAIALLAGDYVEVMLLHTAGSNLTVTGDVTLKTIRAT